MSTAAERQRRCRERKREEIILAPVRVRAAARSQSVSTPSDRRRWTSDCRSGWVSFAQSLTMNATVRRRAGAVGSDIQTLYGAMPKRAEIITKNVLR